MVNDNTALLSLYKQSLINNSGGEVSTKTISSYLIDVKYFLNFLGSTKLSDITPKKITEFVSQPWYKYSDKLASSKTIRRRRSAVRSFCDFLMDEGILISNPAILKMKVRSRVPKIIPNSLHPFELEHILFYCKDNVMLKISVQLLLLTGIRLDELLTCTISSIDFENCEIKVIGKGKRERYVPFPKSFADTLKSYIEWRKTVVKDNINELIVLDKGIKPNKNQIEYLFRKLSKKSGIYIHPHLLRHTFATESAKNGMNRASLQLILGHQSQVTTDLYIHIKPDVRKDYDAIYK